VQILGAKNIVGAKPQEAQIVAERKIIPPSTVSKTREPKVETQL
jgi:hypothetical protein